MKRIAAGFASMALLAGCGSGSSGDAANTGAPAPLPVCSLANPCTRPAPELGVSQITEPSFVPVCATSQAAQDAGRPPYDDGAPVQRVDEAGINRYACLYQPPGASASTPYPLVVFLHGGGAGTASNVYDFTSLRTKAVGHVLGADAARPGFFLLSIQGRNLHYPTFNNRDGRHHDFYFRDLGMPSTNPDIAHLDRRIDELVATGAVDPQRIYVVGWSNGGFFGQMYAIARHATPTPGGNRVAAAVPYSAADPFHNTNHGQVPSYQLDPYPTSTVPILLVSRSCDIVACNQAQADWLLAGFGAVTEPGHVVQTWIAQDLPAKVQNPNGQWLIVSGAGQVVGACSPDNACTRTIGLVNHLRWPDGVADGGDDHEPAMLDFLRGHPLP